MTAGDGGLGPYVWFTGYRTVGEGFPVSQGRPVKDWSVGYGLAGDLAGAVKSTLWSVHAVVTGPAVRRQPYQPSCGGAGDEGECGQ